MGVLVRNYGNCRMYKASRGDDKVNVILETSIEGALWINLVTYLRQSSIRNLNDICFCASLKLRVFSKIWGFMKLG